MNALEQISNAPLNLEHLYHNHRMAVFNICYAYTKSREEANDLVQETFIKAHLGLAGFERRCQPKTWLIRIAINQSLTRILANKREQRNLAAYLVNETLEHAQDRDDAPMVKLGVEEVLQRTDITTQKVLLLCFGQGLTHSQIAKTLGVSRVAVTRRITRFKEAARLTTDQEKSIRKVKVFPKMTGSKDWVREPSPASENQEYRKQLATT